MFGRPDMRKALKTHIHKLINLNNIFKLIRLLITLLITIVIRVRLVDQNIEKMRTFGRRFAYDWSTFCV
ncbi:MAG: hypothetical protein A3F11_06915 [Gammaproteobacteria bacterium RIFCSPHIGHO2_12_FULL_37_14]|nr:MAG: hypothetical protein A3F11_06915 [Gammaproteobacteria bacterium RIFCSPHIGHO2_12_FULL_37_14]